MIIAKFTDMNEYVFELAQYESDPNVLIIQFDNIKHMIQRADIKNNSALYLVSDMLIGRTLIIPILQISYEFKEDLTFQSVRKFLMLQNSIEALKEYVETLKRIKLEEYFKSPLALLQLAQNF